MMSLQMLGVSHVCCLNLNGQQSTIIRKCFTQQYRVNLNTNILKVTAAASNYSQQQHRDDEGDDSPQTPL